MNEPERVHPRRAVGALEYVGPAVAILVLVFAGWWYVSQVWKRVEQRPPDPRPELRLSPRNGTQNRPLDAPPPPPPSVP